MHEDDHVTRKVQLTGGSTYTVSLPKGWADDQDIEPGATVSLHSMGEQLVVQRAVDEQGTRDHVTTIPAATRSPATLARSVAAAYVAGSNEVHVTDLNGRDQRRAVGNAIRDFVGFEVMDEDDTSIVARTMLDTGELSSLQTLTQLERTTLLMHTEAIDTVLEADAARAARVADQDDEVDRLFALISRRFQQSLERAGPSMDADGLSAFEFYMAARHLERVADHAEKIARVVDRLDGPPNGDVAAELADTGARARGLVRRAVSGIIDEPAELDGVIADADGLITDVEALDERVYHEKPTNGYLLGVVLDSIVRTAEYGVNIAEVGLQARYRTAGRLDES